MARTDDGMVKIALKANMAIAFDGLADEVFLLPAKPVCWFGAFYNMLCAIDRDKAAFARDLKCVSVRTVLNSLNLNWQHKAFDLITSVQAQGLRSIPEDLSVGMKFITNSKWFGQGQAAGFLHV